MVGVSEMCIDPFHYFKYAFGFVQNYLFTMCVLVYTIPAKFCDRCFLFSSRRNASRI